MGIGEARTIAQSVLNLLVTTGTPIDSCILASEFIRETAVALGHTVTMQPVYVKVLTPDESVLYDLEARLPFVPEDYYPGHMVTLIDGMTLVDATALQFLARIDWPYSHDPIVALEAPDFAQGAEARVPVPDGILVYRAFDDGGDWQKGRDVETEAMATIVGKALAAQIQNTMEVSA